MTAKEKAILIAKCLDEKKAQDIKVLDIGKLTSIGDYFVIASGTSVPQVKTLCDEVDKKLSAVGEEPRRREGYRSAAWILLDYNDVVVHIFLKDTREFYGLERLWADAVELDIGL
jgi:ribosome-associated protein